LCKEFGKDYSLDFTGTDGRWQFILGAQINAQEINTIIYNIYIIYNSKLFYTEIMRFLIMRPNKNCHLPSAIDVIGGKVVRVSDISPPLLSARIRIWLTR